MDAFFSTHNAERESVHPNWTRSESDACEGCFSVSSASVWPAGCSQPQRADRRAAAALAAAPSKPKLGIKPFGTADPNFKPDYSKLPPELQKTFAYIDEHIDEHVENLTEVDPSAEHLQQRRRHSRERRDGEGLLRGAGMPDARVYDTGITEYGSPGNPVVYAKCDEGAPKTVAIYWMYDTMPVTQPDNWIAPPFEARVVDGPTAVVPNASRVIIGRGAANSKGGEMAQLNAIHSMKAVMGKLPVNLIWVAEGDEERMDIGLRKFFADHSDLLRKRMRCSTAGRRKGASTSN